MKIKIFPVLLILILGAAGWSGRGWTAKESKQDKPAAPPASAPAPVLSGEQREAFRKQVKAHIAALSFQDVTVQILGTQYQKEMGNLQQMQAVFCDTYQLDVNKFRQGQYRFDEKEAKFVEQEPAA